MNPTWLRSSSPAADRPAVPPLGYTDYILPNGYTIETAHQTIREEIRAGHSPRRLEIDALADGAVQVTHVSQETAATTLRAALARYVDLTGGRRASDGRRALWVRYYNDPATPRCFCASHFDIERVESDERIEILARTDDGAGEVYCETCSSVLA